MCCVQYREWLNHLWAISLHMDTLDLFPREDGVTPFFLLLDGHGSRLELPFLQYINNPLHDWIVCIGVPYGTSCWLFRAKWKWIVQNGVSDGKKRISTKKNKEHASKMHVLKLTISLLLWMRHGRNPLHGLSTTRKRLQLGDGFHWPETYLTTPKSQRQKSRHPLLTQAMKHRAHPTISTVWLQR